MKKTFLLLFSLLTATAATAQQDGARFRKVDSLMTYLYDNGKFMGTLALSEKGKIVFEKSYGYSDLEGNIAATPETKYKVGSVAKMFTSAIIFQLIEEKKLTPDTKLSQFFPKVANADRISISDMLYHKSGIHDYATDVTFIQYNTKLQTRKAMTDRIIGFEPDFEPGEKAAYSNSNYLLLGYIIQDITKKTYKENVAERIAKRAGLKNTYYFGKNNPKKNEAWSYKKVDGKWVRQEEWSESVAGAAGGLISTASDLTKFITALFEGKIVTKPSLDQMLQLDMGYGRGILPYPFAERRLYGHNGGIEGFSSAVAIYPKDNMAFALLQNGNDYDSNEIINGILSIYYKLPYRFPSLTKEVEVAEPILKSYEGNYKTQSLPFIINIKLVDGKLRVHADEQGTFYLTALNDTDFTHESGIVMTFTPKSFILKQNGTETVFNKQ